MLRAFILLPIFGTVLFPAIEAGAVDQTDKVITFYNFDNFLKFNKMIFSDLPGIEFEKRNPFAQSDPSVSKIIYNQKGYDRDLGRVEGEKGIVKVEGQKLEFEWIKKSKNPRAPVPKIPIGYNIFLPHGEVKGVIVVVYGGSQSKNLLTSRREPETTNLQSQERYLLSQGIVVVTLNLIDLRELQIFQDAMPEEIHNKLHASIDYFINTLRSDKSEIIFAGFEIPKTARIILFGGSFGGGVTLRHAEISPRSFDGYISQDGAISRGSFYDLPIVNYDRENIPGAKEAGKWLSPLDEDLKAARLQSKDRLHEKDSKVENIQKPILLLHNFDDNDVNVKVSLDFYKEAMNTLDDDRRNLVQLLITRRGNPAPNSIEHPGSGYFKGHSFPTDLDAFESYARTIANFVLYGPEPVPSRSKWMAHQYEIYANKYYRGADNVEKFISEAYRLYKQKKYKQKDGLSQETLEKPRPQEGEQEEITKFDRDWATMYEPIYVVLFAMTPDQQAEYLRHFMIDQNIENALLRQLPLFFEFLKEFEGIDAAHQLSLADLSRNRTLQEKYKEFLSRKNLKKLFQDNLLLANPELIKAIFEDWKKKEGELEENSQQLMELAKKNLWERIQEDKRHIVEISHEIANLPSYKPERSMDEIFMSLQNKDAKFELKNYTDMLQFASRISENKDKIYRDQAMFMMKERYRKIIEIFKNCSSLHDCRLNYASALVSLGIVEGNIEKINKAKEILGSDEKVLDPLFGAFSERFDQ